MADLTDRQLLELAARAALGRTSIADQHRQMVEKGWNPLEDEAAAFRLAVKLHMTIRRETARAVVTVDGYPDVVVPFIAEDRGEYLGTQRAIVIAAASMARQAATTEGS